MSALLYWEQTFAFFYYKEYHFSKSLFLLLQILQPVSVYMPKSQLGCTLINSFLTGCFKTARQNAMKKGQTYFYEPIWLGWLFE